MNKENKDFLKHLFHHKEHTKYEPDYYSWKYEMVAEEKDSVDLRLDVRLLRIPIHDLVTNLMEWGMMITRLVIASDQFDNEWLSLQITEIPKK